MDSQHRKWPFALNLLLKCVNQKFRKKLMGSPKLAPVSAVPKQMSILTLQLPLFFKPLSRALYE